MKAKAFLSCVLGITIARSCCYQHFYTSQNALNDTYFSQYTLDSDFLALKHKNKILKPLFRGSKIAYMNETFNYDPYQKYRNHSFSSFFDVRLPSNIFNVIDENDVSNQVEQMIKSLFQKLLLSHQQISSTDTHRELLIQSLLRLSQGLERFGLINSCTSSSEAYFYQLISKAVENFFWQHYFPPGQNSNMEHGFKSIINFLWDVRGKGRYCDNKVLKSQKHKINIEEFVRLIDPDLADYLTSRIFPMQSILSRTNDRTPLFLSGVHYICDLLNETAQENFESCKSKVSEVIEFLRINLPIENNEMKKRTRRASESKVIEGVKRNGYNGYGSYGGSNGYQSHGGYKSDGYDDESYIIIPEDEESDYKHIYLIKILAAWAFGAYSLLGLLAYQIYFTSAINNGNPGFKGPPGPSGDAGIKGGDGMPGDQGIDGDSVIGDPGDAGEKGMKGVKGPPGNMGVVGPKGMTGAAGPQGSPGQPGEDSAKGASGPAGQAGSTRMKQRNRKRRYVEKSLMENDVFNVDLKDSAVLLRSLYEGKDIRNKKTKNKLNHIVFAETLNRLWKDFKDPLGCLKCSLFDLLYSSDSVDVDPYIIAGFAHVLGESSSLQVLHEVRKAKSRGFTLLCKRKKNTCTLEHSVDVVA